MFPHGAEQRLINNNHASVHQRRGIAITLIIKKL